MYQRIAATFVVLTLSASCAPKTRAGAGAMLAGGGALAFIGGATLADLSGPGNDSDGNGRDDFPEKDLACAMGGCALGLVVLTAGVVMMISAGVKLSESSPEAPPSQLNLKPAAQAAPAFAAIEPRILPPLPVVACDAETLRMAQQARALAHRGLCEPAHKVMSLMSQRDPVYASHMKVSAALQPCS